MPRQPRKIASTGFYHVIVRGNGKQLLFADNTDRTAFLGYLEAHASKNAVDILAWCLMDNHVHLCLSDAEETGTERLSEMMRGTQTAYAAHFNLKAGHIGHVFQGRFESMPIESAAYLLQAVRYIHNNPEKAGICRADAYAWSSYREYVEAPRICNTSIVLDELGGIEAFIAFSQEVPERPYCFSSSRRMDDSAAYALAMETLEAFGEAEPHLIKSLPRDKRDAILQTLRAQGVRLDQLVRLTGLGKNTISRATGNRA